MNDPELISKLRDICEELNGRSCDTTANAYVVMVSGCKGWRRQDSVKVRLLSGENTESKLLTKLREMQADGEGKAIGFIGYEAAGLEGKNLTIRIQQRLFSKFSRKEWADTAMKSAEEYIHAKFPFALVGQRPESLMRLNSGIKEPLAPEEQGIIKAAIAKVGGRRALREDGSFVPARRLAQSNPSIKYHEGVVWEDYVFLHRAWVTVRGKIYDPLQELRMSQHEYFGIQIPTEEIATRSLEITSGNLSSTEVSHLEARAREIRTTEGKSQVRDPKLEDESLG